MKKRVTSVLLTIALVASLFNMFLPGITLEVGATASKITTNLELVERALNVANNYKTLYVMGGWGQPLTEANKKTLIDKWDYNQQPDRTAMINAASEDTFAFDCVCLIKGLLWGWDGTISHTNGGAVYGSNGVSDTNATDMINYCYDVSTDFSNIEVGEILWMTGHVGIYIGDGLAVECTPAWKNCVQITAYNAQAWTKHGKLQYVTYVPPGYLSQCSGQPSYCSIEVIKKTTIKTLPCSRDTCSDSDDIKTLSSGTLTATKIYKNTANNYWYKVTYDGKDGYVYSGDTKVVKFLTDDVKISGVSAPTSLTQGSSFSIKGTISSSNNILSNVAAYVYPGSAMSGTASTGTSANINAYSYSLAGSAVDNGVVFNVLSNGNYTYCIFATAKSYYCTDGKNLQSNTARKTLHTSSFSVSSSRPTQQFTCLISSPAEGAVVPKSAYPVIGTLTSAYYQIKEVKAYIDGSCYATVSNVNATSLELRPTAINQNLNFAALSSGKHVLRIDARDSQSSSFVTVINRTFYTETVETHTHQYSYETTTQPTCTTDGVKTYTCSCGDSYTEVVPAYGHNWCGWEVKQYPTCTTPGYRERLCQWCYGIESEEVPVIDHTYGSVRYESPHPHRAYRECNCGYVNYTGAYGTLEGCTACLGVSNIGEDFYALIIADKSNIYLEAGSSRNVELACVNDADDPKQIWHFLRQSDGTYKIINEYTGLVLDASDFGTENGTNVGVWENNDLSAQRWKISGGNPYIIAASYSDTLVLDVAGGNHVGGENIQLWGANGTDAQLFNIYRIEWNGVNYQKPAAPDPSKIIDISSSNGITTVTWSESTDRGRYDDRVYDLRIWEGNVPDGSTGAYFTAYCIGDTSYKVELPNGTYTFMVTAVNQMYYEHYTKGEFVLHTINSKFDVDLNAYIDGQVVGNTKGYGTADVYINGKLVADDVTDYCSQWPVGTTYEFKDIKPNPGYSYNGVYEGQRVGTVGNERAWIAFDFSKIDNSIIEEQGEEHYYNGRRYLYFKTPLTWYAANEYCKSIGGHLVTINDSGEDNFVRSMFDSGKYVWIGATDQNSEGNWTWVTGEPFNYTYWGDSQPDDSTNINNDGEDFAHYAVSGKWNDIHGDCVYGFICEFSGCDHFYMIDVVEPTCTSSGYTLNTCINCGDSYKDDYKAALGHDNSYEVTSKPTTSETGKLTGTCSRCRETATVTLPKLNTTDYTYEVTKTATCTTAGIGRYIWKDTSYGKFYFDVAIGKTEHSYSTTLVAPTCTAQGYTMHTCSCGDSYKDNYTAAMGHSYSSGSCVNCGAADPGAGNFHNPFEDVKEKDYFYMPVLWAVQKGITNGTSATKFSPEAPCTRGQIVTFLWRACGSPEPNMAVNPFTDVSSSAYYYKAVLWALENGITTGTGRDKFSPEATCTRGQVATFLWRAQGKPAPTSSNNPFNDVNSDAYYYNAILWAVEKGVTNGTGKGKFSPDASCTRGQIVTFLYRAMN